MNHWVWIGAAALVLLILLRRPLKALGGLLLRSGGGLLFLWAFQGVGGWLGIQLGVNLFNALVLGTLGVPGLALLLMIRWTGG